MSMTPSAIAPSTIAKDAYILQENHITLATITNAKGYDSPIVFVMGLDGFDFGPQARPRLVLRSEHD